MSKYSAVPSLMGRILRLMMPRQLKGGMAISVETESEVVRRERSRLVTMRNRFLRNRAATAGVVVLGLLAAVALAAPLIAPYDPIEVSPRNRLLPPSVLHPMGTDAFGRDVMSRVIFGARLSLTLGFIAVGIAGSLGTLAGLTAGYFGGRIDKLLTLVIDVMLAFPGILLALTISATLGPGLQNAMLAVGIASVPQYMRVARGSVLSAKESTYVTAARALGCPSGRIMFRHVLPNIVAPILVLASLGIGTAILVGATISFLGLGAQPPTPEWGAMVSYGRNYVRAAWWLSTFPGLAIMLTVVSTNMVGDGLRYALDPRLQDV
jgi:peptide/nickel transport system permease protein